MRKGILGGVSGLSILLNLMTVLVQSVFGNPDDLNRLFRSSRGTKKNRSSRIYPRMGTGNRERARHLRTELLSTPRRLWTCYDMEGIKHVSSTRRSLLKFDEDVRLI